MRLVPNLPKEWFPKLDNIKLYVGSLQKPLHDILDMETFQQLPANIINTKIPNTRHITFVRHLESKYNEYKELIKANPDYQEFMRIHENVGTAHDIKLKMERKKELAGILLEDFFKEVGIDYETWLSTAWHEQWKQLSPLYAQLIKENPTLFPDLMYISPYIRTRQTAHYFLKDIAWLDMDFDKLVNEDMLKDLIVWSFNGKDIAIKIDERIRERDHWSNIAPSFIRDFWDGEKWFHHLLNKKQREKIYYYTSPAGGESQVYTNARAKDFLSKIYEKVKYKNVWGFGHHLEILWWIQSISGWSFETFYKLNEMRRPANGSFTILSQIPKTEAGEEDKFRISWYNLSLEA